MQTVCASLLNSASRSIQRFSSGISRKSIGLCRFFSRNFEVSIDHRQFFGDSDAEDFKISAAQGEEEINRRKKRKTRRRRIRSRFLIGGEGPTNTFVRLQEQGHLGQRIWPSHNKRSSTDVAFVSSFRIFEDACFPNLSG